jgi:putative transposase
VREAFEASGSRYGSPRVHDDLVDPGWAVSEKTVAASMAAQGLVGRPKRRYHCLTRPDKTASPFPDLVKRDFSAPAINEKWCGDLTEISAQEDKLYLASVIDLASRRLPGFAIGEHHDAPLAAGALKMAAAIRGGDVKGVVFHSDRGSEFTASLFGQACEALAVAPSMGRVGSMLRQRRRRELALDARVRAVEPPALCHQGRGPPRDGQVNRLVNRARRHSTREGKSPLDYEALLAERAAKTAHEADAA